MVLHAGPGGVVLLPAVKIFVDKQPDFDKIRLVRFRNELTYPVYKEEKE